MNELFAGKEFPDKYNNLFQKVLKKMDNTKKMLTQVMTHIEAYSEKKYNKENIT